MVEKLKEKESVEYIEEDSVNIEEVFALHGINSGCCLKLLGKVVIVAFLVDDAESRWTDTAREKFVEVLKQSADEIMRQSGFSKSKLMIAYAHCKVSVPYVVTRKNHENCVKDVLTQFGFGKISEYQKHYEKKFARDEAPMLFVFNKPFRSYAARAVCKSFHEKEAVTDANEWAFISYKAEHENKNTLIHELMHQFGAIDYYYPSQVKALAGAYFPGSIMDGGTVIDPLTRYVIGWDEELSPESKAFLRDISSVSEEDVRLALIEEWDKEF